MLLTRHNGRVEKYPLERAAISGSAKSLRQVRSVKMNYRTTKESNLQTTGGPSGNRTRVTDVRGRCPNR